MCITPSAYKGTFFLTSSQISSRLSDITMSRVEPSFSILSTHSASSARGRQRSLTREDHRRPRLGSGASAAAYARKSSFERAKVARKKSVDKQNTAKEEAQSKAPVAERKVRPASAHRSRISQSQRMYLKSKHSVSGIKARVRRNPRQQEISSGARKKWDRSCSIEYKRRLSQGVKNLHTSEVLEWITEIPEFYRSNREIQFLENSNPEKIRARRMKHSLVCQTLFAATDEAAEDKITRVAYRRNGRDQDRTSGLE